MEPWLLGLILLQVTFTLAIVEKPDETSIIAQDNHVCLKQPKVANLKQFFPSLTSNQWEVRCQMPHGNKPTSMEETSWRALKKETQYLTVFNPIDKIPVFSAYIAEPYKIVTTHGQKKAVDIDNQKIKRESDWEESSTVGPKNADYEIEDNFDKGHLFPKQFSDSKEQAKSSFKLTNAVPQDKTFNQQQWKTAETILKEKLVQQCQLKGFTPIIITGVVPNYYGYGRDSQNIPKLKIGQKPNNQRFIWDMPENIESQIEEKILVPTHMWTYYRCIDNIGNKESEIVNQLSFIGLNHQVGVVKWYLDFNEFEKTLIELYGLRSTTMFKQFKDSKHNDQSSLNHDWIHKIMAMKDTEWPAAMKYKMILPGESIDLAGMRQDDRAKKIEDKLFWQNIHLDSLRKDFEQQKITATANRMGIELTRIELGKKVDTQSVKRKLAIMDFVDLSATSDISLKECTIKETYQGKEELHTINFEKKVFNAGKARTGDNIKVEFKVRPGPYK